MKIVRLEAENVLRLSAVEITPTGDLVVLGGENAQGKSSVLTCIEMALAGGKAIPAMPVKRGQTKGRIVVDLGDIVVERRFDPKGTDLVVKAKDGKKFTSPQRMLDDLVGRLSFDPDSFRRMERKQQRETLMKLVGLDFAEIDRKRQATFDARTEVNRTVKQLQTRLQAAPGPHDGMPAEEISVKDLVAEKDARAATNLANEKKRALLRSHNEGTDELKSDLPDLEKAVEDAKAALRQAEQDLESRHREIESRTIDADKLAAEIEVLVDANVAEVAEQIDGAESKNRKIRENKARTMLVDQLKAEENRAQVLTNEIADAEQQKADLLAGAQFPVEGLAVDDDGVTFNGIPLEQASGVESIKISVAIGFKLNPKLKVVLVRNPSYIGEEYLRAIGEIAHQEDGQVWLERGGDGPECSVILSDGRVRETQEQESEPELATA